MASKPRTDRFYYAGGEKVPLDLDDDLIAVDESQLQQSGLSKKTVTQLLKQAQPLRRGVALLNRGETEPELLDELEEQGLAHPVYRAEGAVLVPLAEVRIEESRDNKTRQIEEWIGQHSTEVVCISQTGRRTVVKPSSNDPDAALDIANQLHEAIGPELAQARFLRVVPRGIRSSS